MAMDLINTLALHSFKRENIHVIVSCNSWSWWFDIQIVGPFYFWSFYFNLNFYQQTETILNMAHEIIPYFVHRKRLSKMSIITCLIKFLRKVFINSNYVTWSNYVVYLHRATLQGINGKMKGPIQSHIIAHPFDKVE